VAQKTRNPPKIRLCWDTALYRQASDCAVFTVMACWEAAREEKPAFIITRDFGLSGRVPELETITRVWLRERCVNYSFVVFFRSGEICLASYLR